MLDLPWGVQYDTSLGIFICTIRSIESGHIMIKSTTRPWPHSDLLSYDINLRKIIKEADLPQSAVNHPVSKNNMYQIISELLTKYQEVNTSRKTEEQLIEALTYVKARI